MKHAVELYPHQRKAVEDLANGKILNGGVGVGKSITSAGYYMEKEAPKDVYVITTAKKRDSMDWEDEFIKFGVGTKTSVAGILRVDSWQSIAKYKNVRGAFFIFDEQRLVGSGAWVHAFIRIAKHNRWIMLSATPGDTWIDYVPVFIANGFYQNRTEFKENHVVYASYTKYPKIERYRDTYKLLKLRDSILVKMEYKRHTTRVAKEIVVDFDEEKMKTIIKDRWNVFEDRPIRTGSEFFALMRRVAYTHPSRLDAVRKVLEIHPRLILFYSFNYELDILRTLAEPKQQVLNTKEVGELANESLVVAEWNGQKHEEVPDDDRWLYLVQYAAGSEGWNCITTDATAFYSQTYSYRSWAQGHGRIDRLNTPYSILKYYYLTSKADIDIAVKAALNEKKDFNEAEFVSKFWRRSRS